MKVLFRFNYRNCDNQKQKKLMDIHLKKKLLEEASPVMDSIRLRVINELLKRYCDGEASAEERAIVEAWNAEYYWEKGRRAMVDDVLMEEGCEEVKSRLMTQIREKEQRQRASKRNEWRFWSWHIGRYAAMAAMLVVLLYIGHSVFDYTQSPQQQKRVVQICFQTNTHEIKRICLPDSSLIYLNRGSKLYYNPQWFNKSQRDVWLEGEAFFEVAKDKTKPFVVHSNKLETVVRGTSFNIKAYRELDQSVVSVRSGKVEVANSNRQTIASLTRNRQLTYNTDADSYHTTDMNWMAAAGWMEGKLVLCNANTKELQLKIKQYFNADLTVEGAILDGVMFNSSFDKGSALKDILERICVLYNVHYVLKGNKIQLHA